MKHSLQLGVGSTSDYIAIAALLLSLAASWKIVFGKNGSNGYIRRKEFAELKERFAVLANDHDWSQRRIADLEGTVYNNEKDRRHTKLGGE